VSRMSVDDAAAAVATPRGDISIAEVVALNYDGRGVARIAGKATFIEGALPGERVRFRYHNKGKAYDSGAVREILVPSPDRAAPPCQHFGTCGGCSLQHLHAPAQIAAKQQVLADTLTHVGRVQPRHWLAPLPGPALGYRRRTRLGVRCVESKGGVLIGFREKRSSYIAPLDRCLTLDPRISALLPGLRSLVGSLSRPDRVPQIEAAAGEHAIALVLRHLEPLTPADRAQLVAFGARENVQMYLQPRGPDSVEPVAAETGGELTYTLPEFGLTLGFGPSDFVQINSDVNRKLVHQAVSLLDIQPADAVLDLFCGLGNFTLAAARRAIRVVGVEADAALVERARANARANALANAEFRVADLYQSIAPPVWAGETFDKVILDPPRAGAIEAIKRLAPVAPQRIVYVACHPATLARDSAYLVNVLGYRLEAAGVADMFAHTSHVESIALFVRG